VVKVRVRADYLATIVGGNRQPLKILFHLGADGVIANVIDQNIEQVPNPDCPVVFQVTSS